MITIPQLQDFLQENQTEIAAINSNYTFIDDSQLTAILRDSATDDNTILVGLLPSFKIEGANLDAVYTRNHLLFMLLNKVDRNESHEALLTTMQQIHEAVKLFIKKLINDATDDAKPCHLAKMIDVNSIQIDPIWKLAGTSGYTIEMQLKTNLWD